MDTRAERLAQARKKLRDYQSKHRNLKREDMSSPSPSVSSMVENSGRQSTVSLQLCNHDDSKSAFERVRTVSQGCNPNSATQVSSNDENLNTTSSHLREIKSKLQNGTAELLINGTEDSFDFKQECVRLKEELALRAVEKEELSNHLSELVRHYSEIHAAYAKLSGSITDGESNGSAMQTQLVHLQTAMSVVVREKTDLQQQLREACELAENRFRQIQNITIDLNDKTSQIMALEAEVTSLHKEIDVLSNAMQKKVEELENDRKEAVSWQAKVLRVQQDRNDAQERLKVYMKETEVVQAELEEARKQLRMKDIYLRQLGTYTGSVVPSENDARNSSDEFDRLRSDLAKALSEAERWKKEAHVAREHYDSYGAQLNQNMIQMSNKLEEVSNEKLRLETKVDALECEIETLKTLNKQKTALTDDCNDTPANMVELRKMQDTLNKTVDDLHKTRQLNENLKEELISKENKMLELSAAYNAVKSNLEEKSDELMKTKESLARARSFADEQQKHTVGALSLAEQLQNEKATVSRAIAQNRELKEQLIELQDKLVIVTQESMERESGRLSALHLVAQLRNEVDRLNAQLHDQHVSSAQLLPNGDIYSQSNHCVELQDRDETISTPSISACNDHDTAFSHTEEVHALAEAELMNTKIALDELRVEHRRIAQENEELRRIMEQNSEDENQNNIHVELGQAVERINTLSSENEQLRYYVNMLQEKLQNSSLSNSAISSPHSKNVPSEQLNEVIAQQLLAPAFVEKPLAWTELEARFTRAMRQVADLAEEKERLQHIVMQLETENDTIGDYVTLYQHQRKKITERMREREEAVAKLSFEKEQMQQKLNELQKTLMHLLTKRGLLRMYEHEKETSKSSNRPSKRAREIRSYSHSTADELSGDEETVVDGSNLLVPNNQDFCVDNTSEYDSTSLNSGTEENKSSNDVLQTDPDDDVGVQKILNLISELQDLERTRTLPPCGPNLHCSECRGKLINL